MHIWLIIITKPEYSAQICEDLALILVRKFNYYLDRNNSFNVIIYFTVLYLENRIIIELKIKIPIGKNRPKCNG